MKTRIINQFTNCAWFKRGVLSVRSDYSKLQNGRFNIFYSVDKSYTRRFFIRPATDEELTNAGLLEVAKGALMLHTEFEVPFSDGREVTVTVNGEEISGVTLSSVITWHGWKYRIMQKADWSDWGHYYYFLEKMIKKQTYA